jgi:SAM-dependent methyltransferase
MQMVSASYAKCYNDDRSQEDEQARIIIELLSKHLGELRNISVLDVGSGAGRIAVPLGRVVAKIVCVEPALVAAEQLKARLAAERIKFEIHTNVIEDLNPRDVGLFDVVILSHILHWLECPSEFAGSDRFVRPGGCLVISLFSRENLAGMLLYKVFGDSILKLQEDMTPQTSELKSSLLSLGFDVVADVEVPVRTSYAEGRLERIIAAAGTLSLQKAMRSLPKEEYDKIVRDALDRLSNTSDLSDTEYRTVIIAKRPY